MNSLFALTAVLAVVQTASASRLFFTDQPSQPAGAPGSVISVNLDGTDQRTVTTVTSAPDLRGIAWHADSKRIFFLDNGTAKAIFALSANGENAQQIRAVNPDLLSADLEIDAGRGKLYWAESNAGTTGHGFIQRANLDGTGLETVVSTAPGSATTPYFLFLDPLAEYVYWGVLSSGNGPSTFQRATLAGVLDTSFQITTATRTRDLVVDPATATIYWCDRQTGNLFKRGLSGGQNQIVLGGMNAPHGLAYDGEAGKLYWADTAGRGSGPFNTSARRVARANVDGTGYENLSTPAANSEPWDLALDLASPTYADWRARFFSTNSPLSGPTDDADADGAVNLLEYALGTHPQNPASQPRLVPTQSGLQYARRRGANLEYRVEASTDLATWHYNNEDASGVEWTTEVLTLPQAWEMEIVVVTAGPALAGAPRAYFRLRVSAP
jgi:hypothetical protein